MQTSKSTNLSLGQEPGEGDILEQSKTDFWKSRNGLGASMQWF
jgi:hypothetical protein